MSNRNIIYNIRVMYAQAVAGFRRVGQEARNAHLHMDNMSRVGRTTLPYLGVVATTIGASMARGISQAEQAAVAFELSLAKMQGLASLSAKETEKLGEAALGLTHTGQGPQALAEAMYFIASAGHDATAALDIVTHSAMAASAGLGSVQDVAKLVGGIINAYGDNVLSAAHASDVLVNTVRLGAAEASEVANTIGRAIPIAAEMGITFEDVGASIALMTRNSTNAYIATTQLRGMMSQILQPSKQAKDTLEQFGVSFGQVRAEIKEKGLLAGLEMIREATDNNNAAIGRIFPNVRGLVGYLALMGDNIHNTREVFDDFTNVTGRAQKAYDAYSKTAAAAHDRFNASLEAFKIKAGSSVLPVAKAILSGFTSILNIVSKVPAPLMFLATTFLFLAGAALALGPRLVLLSYQLHGMGVSGGVAGAMLRGLGFAMRALPWIAVAGLIGENIRLMKEYADAAEEVDMAVAKTQAFQPNEKSSVEALESQLESAKRKLQEIDKLNLVEILTLGIVETEQDKEVRKLQDEIVALEEAIANANESANSFGEASSQAASEFLTGLLGKSDEVNEIAMALRFFVISGRLSQEQALLVSYSLKKMQDQGLLTAEVMAELVRPETLAKLRYAAENGTSIEQALLDIIPPAVKAAAGIEEMGEESAAFLNKLQEIHDLTGVAVPDLKAIGEEGVKAFEDIIDAADKAKEAFLETFGLIENLEMPPTAEEAAKDLADALDKVADAQDRLKSAEDKLAENAMYLVRSNSKEREREKAIRDIEDAQRDLKEAEDEAADARLKAQSPAKAIEAEYKEQVERAKQYIADLQFAIDAGLDPTAAYKASLNPEDYAPILAAIRDDPSLVNVINASEKVLKNFAGQLKEAAIVLGGAVAGELDHLDEETKKKLKEIFSSESNAATIVDAYQTGFSLMDQFYQGMEDAEKVRIAKSTGGKSAASGAGNVPFGPGLKEGSSTGGSTGSSTGSSSSGPIKPGPQSGGSALGPSIFDQGIEKQKGLKGMHTGGLAADEMYAKLQYGEFVINRQSAQAIGINNLMALNSMHTGGAVNDKIPSSPTFGSPGFIDLVLDRWEKFSNAFFFQYKRNPPLSDFLHHFNKNRGYDVDAGTLQRIIKWNRDGRQTTKFGTDQPYNRKNPVYSAHAGGLVGASMYNKAYTPSMQSGSGSWTSNKKTEVNVGTVQAHDYGDFIRQMERQAQLSNLTDS